MPCRSRWSSASAVRRELCGIAQELLVISNSSIIPQKASLSQDVNCWALILQHTGHTSGNQPHYQIFTLVVGLVLLKRQYWILISVFKSHSTVIISLISEQINHIFYLKHNHPIRSITNISWNHCTICSLQKYFLFFPFHSHTPTLSIVIERRDTSSHHNWIASSAVPLLGKQRDNPNLSGERAKKAWQHAARPAQRLPCRAQRREGLPVWNLQGEKNAKPI